MESMKFIVNGKGDFRKGPIGGFDVSCLRDNSVMAGSADNPNDRLDVLAINVHILLNFPVGHAVDWIKIAVVDRFFGKTIKKAPQLFLIGRFYGSNF